MFLFTMLLLFVAACVGGWLIVFPAGRDALTGTLAHVGDAVIRRIGGYSGQEARTARRATGTLRQVMRDAGGWMRRHALLSAAIGALILLPPLAALLLSGRVALPGAAIEERQVNAQVAALLRGERLVAPPAVFTTAEVTLIRPQLAGANRNWDLLDADFTQRLLLVFKLMRERHGYEMVLLEGYRSPERQNELADAGGHVTNARAFQSWHQFGLAGDCAFLRDGKVVISERDPWAMRGYQLYGEVAEAAGLTWGGRWKMLDFGHVELPRRRR